MQNIDTVIVRVLVERGMPTRLDRKIAHMKVGSVFIRTNHHLARRFFGSAVVGSVGAKRDTLPAQFAVFAGSRTMDDAHSRFAFSRGNIKTRLPERALVRLHHFLLFLSYIAHVT